MKKASLNSPLMTIQELHNRFSRAKYVDSSLAHSYHTSTKITRTDQCRTSPSGNTFDLVDFASSTVQGSLEIIPPPMQGREKYMITLHNWHRFSANILGLTVLLRICMKMIRRLLAVSVGDNKEIR